MRSRAGNRVHAATARPAIQSHVVRPDSSVRYTRGLEQARARVER